MEAMETRAVHRHRMPAVFLEHPHMIFRNGGLCQPGEDNDYLIDYGSLSQGEVLLCWQEPMGVEETMSVVRLDTGERWAWSPSVGVYVDTRKGSVHG
jgi:hypothetical protein